MNVDLIFSSRLRKQIRLSLGLVIYERIRTSILRNGVHIILRILL